MVNWDNKDLARFEITVIALVLAIAIGMLALFIHMIKPEFLNTLLILLGLVVLIVALPHALDYYYWLQDKHQAQIP